MTAVAQAHPEPPPRGAAFLAKLNAIALLADRLFERVVPTRLNPLAHTGAIANVAFIVAAVTGILLLPFYSASVHSAYASVQAMGEAPLTAGLLRSLHRLSSDACLVFALVHGFRLFSAARFGKPRRLAWVTGILLVATLLFVGWLGYWLVWDQRAQRIALGTAKMLDGLPIFTDPLSRSFLTNEDVNSLLFFVVFFFHMLVPLAMGIMLWLHISHVSRSRFLPNRALTLWLLASLLIAALLRPATSAGPADLLRPEGSLSLDAFFLLPLFLTDRLSGALLWLAVLFVGLGLSAIPWIFAKGRPAPAIVDASRCNGCTLCVKDCPYDAIQMVPRTDDKSWPGQAQVDPDKCVGCGVCAGSCDPGGIFLPHMRIVDQRQRIESWVEKAVAEGDAPHLAFLCASSAGAPLRVDEETGLSEDLPGYRVLAVPCAGWVQRFTLERALRRGAKGALIVGCGPVEPHYREGGDWTQLRLEGSRMPALRKDKVDAEKIHFVTLSRGKTSELRELAARLRKEQRGSLGERASQGFKRALGPALAAMAFAGIFALGSDIPYAAPPSETQLVVSFKHPGKVGEHCRKVDEAEKAKLPLHMQRDEICERGRSKVRLKVLLDGELAYEQAYEPRGLHGDGNSVAVERLPISPGEHKIEVALGDSHDPSEWTYLDERTVRIGEAEHVVVLFDKVAGFRWHGKEL